MQCFTICQVVLYTIAIVDQRRGRDSPGNGQSLSRVKLSSTIEKVSPQTLRDSRVFAFFERLVDPYPEATPSTPPRGFFAFLWACSKGLRKYLLATTLLTAVIGAFEALLFAFLGNIVDWLSKVQPSQLWTQERTHLLLLGAVLAASIFLVALQSMVKQQTLFGNFPMLLCGNFHRMMLGQSMSFYQDEF